MNLRLNANVIVTDPDGRILLVKLKKGPFEGGLCIPGGGVNPGELCQDTARREVLEETGIALGDPIVPIGFCEVIHEGVNDHKVILLLHATSSAEPAETQDALGMWLSYDEAKDRLIPLAREAIRIWKEKRNYFQLVGDETGITWGWKSKP